MRKLQSAILITIILLMQMSVLAQAPSICTISGVVYNPDGSVAAGAQFRISKIAKNGVLISQGPFTYTADGSGSISFGVVRGSTVFIYSTVAPFNVTGGVAVTVPDTSSASLASLSTVVAVPTNGLTVQTGAGPTTLTNKEGTLLFTNGLKATETSAGVARIEIDSASTAIVPGTRAINATNPVRIDGGASADMSSNRTISLNGLSGLGTANQFLGMNSGATAYEYKSFAVGTSGSDFAVAHSANAITFNLPDASATTRGVVTTGAQTIAGVKTFSSAPILLASPAADPGQGNTTTALLFKGADSSSGSPSSSVNPAMYLQTIRTGGSNGTPQFGYLFNFQALGVAKADTYAFYLIDRLSQDMTGAPSGAYYHDAFRSYALANQTNIPGGVNIAVYAAHLEAERGVAGVRIETTNFELRNFAADANSSTSNIDSTFHFVSSAGGTGHNTGIWYAEGPSNTTAAYFATYFDANSVVQRVFDLSPSTFTLQGTWSATNGSATVSGSGGHAAVEVVAGDWLLINGTYARASSATANSITLAANFSGTTGGSLTITKAPQAMWLRENQAIASLNHAGSARKEFLRYLESDHWKIDEDGVGSIFGGYTSFGTNSLASPSDTLTSGWRSVLYNGGGGANYGIGMAADGIWFMSPQVMKFYGGTSTSPTLSLTLANSGAASFASTIDATGFKVSGAATSGNVLRGNGTNFVSAQLAFTDLSGLLQTSQHPALTGDVTNSAGSLATTIASNSVSDAKLRQSAALSVIGRSANSTGNVADISAGSDFNVLRRSGTSIGFGSIDLSQSGAVGSSVLGVVNGGSGVATTNSVCAYNSADISIANNSETVLTFDSERWDTNSLHSTASNTSRLTAPIDGVYAISVNLEFDTNNTGNRYFVVKLNGATYLAAPAINATGGGLNTGMSFVRQYKLTAGDYIEVYVFQNSGGSLNIKAIGNRTPEVQMTRVSAGV